ncbi:hypothetical protein OG194_04900 [Streptomyces sp. NBC_01288]|nr:hypothetical protein OG194_04900 [Streptomyces sp. NBC_01288]
MRQSSRETARAERQEIMASLRIGQRDLNCVTPARSSDLAMCVGPTGL